MAGTNERVVELLAERAKVLAELAAELAELPAGYPRRQAVRDMAAAGIRKAEMARLMGVSDARIAQLVNEGEADQ